MNPFDLKAALLARHAQHVVLIHFPIALFISSMAFDAIALWKSSRTLAAAYYNLLAAALSTLPAVATGLLAWQLQLDGARLGGNLRLNLIFALLSTGAIGLIWWLEFRVRCKQRSGKPAVRLVFELATVVLVALLPLWRQQSALATS
jgi:uncharacterized membrane protein